MNDIKESLLMIPSGIKEGKLYSFRPNDGTGDFTVDRNSTATYIDEDGILKTALANEVRFDWSTGVPVILRELQSTNLIPYSKDFSQWELGGGNLTTSNGKIYETTQDGQHRFRILSNVDIGTYTQTIFIKDFELTDRYIALYPQGSAIGGAQYIIFDLNTDTITKKTSNIEGRIYNKGQYKVLELTYTVTSAGTWFSHLYFSNSPTSPSAFYVGDSSKFIEVVGFQLEAGSTASSYIPTAGVTETRLEDLVVDAGDSTTFNSEEGVLFVEMAALSNDSTNNYITISDGTSSNRIILRYVNGDRINIYMTNDNGGLLSLNNYTDITETKKIAVKWSQDSVSFWDNGVKVGESLSFNTFSINTLNVIDLASHTYSLPIYAKIKQLKVFKTALTDQQLTDLTTL